MTAGFPSAIPLGVLQTRKENTEHKGCFFLSLVSLKKQGTRKSLHQHPKPQTKNNKNKTHCPRPQSDDILYMSLATIT